MSKLTRKELTINTLKGHSGIKLGDIPNLTEWLLSYKQEYKTGELASFLKKHGVVFKSDKHSSSELSNYLPPKASIHLSLEPYIKRLNTLYLENFRKHQPAKLNNQATSDLDVQVLTQWVENIHALDKLKRTSLRNLALYHPDKKLILEAREQAFYAVRAEIQLGIEYDSSSLFSTQPNEQSSEPVEQKPKQVNDAETLDLLLDVVKTQQDLIKNNYSEITKLKDELEQIKTLLDIKVKDLLRAVK